MITEERATLRDRYGSARSPSAGGSGRSSSAFSDAQLCYLWRLEEDEVRASPAGGRCGHDVQDRRHVRRRVRSRARRTTTRPTRTPTRSRPASAKRSSSSARARTASVRASSSTTAVCTRASRCATPATRRSWSTATPRPCRPTTTRPTGLYFEPLTYEDVMDVIEREQPTGCDRQPRWADAAEARRADSHRSSCSGRRRTRSTGRGPRAVERDLRSPRDSPAAGGTAVDIEQALRSPARSVTRRSCGRATCSAVERWRSSTTTITSRAMAELAGFGILGKEGGLSAERPVLVDRFLEDATEVDVDALRDAHGRSVHRRGHGACRGGRGALRRLGLLDPAHQPRADTIAVMRSTPARLPRPSR